MADSHWRTLTRIPNAAIGDWDPRLDLCNVNIQHVTIVVKGKTLRIRVRIRVRQCETAVNVNLFFNVKKWNQRNPNVLIPTWVFIDQKHENIEWS